MSARPTHIRVARLPLLAGCTVVTANRRSNAGTYGTVTRDADGWKQVAIAEVERVHGRVFDDAEIARALGTPSTNSTNLKRRAERLSLIEPEPISISGLPTKLSREDAISIIRLYLDLNNAAWRRALANAKYQRS